MSKPTLKMTHGAIGEAMCCYTDGSYKDADIALTEYENSIRADERAKVLDLINTMDFDFGDFYDHTRRIKEMIRTMITSKGEQKND